MEECREDFLEKGLDLAMPLGNNEYANNEVGGWQFKAGPGKKQETLSEKQLKQKLGCGRQQGVMSVARMLEFYSVAIGGPDDLGVRMLAPKQSPWEISHPVLLLRLRVRSKQWKRKGKDPGDHI
jgi:hypothetical protein